MADQQKRNDEDQVSGSGGGPRSSGPTSTREKSPESALGGHTATRSSTAEGPDPGQED